MTGPQNSDGIDVERKGFLSKREREFLIGELEIVEDPEAEKQISKNYSYKLKSTIKSKTRDAIRDFDLVFANLPDEEKEKLLLKSNTNQDTKPPSLDDATALATLQSAKMHLNAVAGADDSDVSGKETVGIVMKLVRRVLTADDKIRGAFDVMTDVFADYRSKDEIIQYIEDTWPETEE